LDDSRSSGCLAEVGRTGTVEESIAVEAARPLFEAGPGAKVILFGSRAREDARAASDLDFLVVEREFDNLLGEKVRLRRTLEPVPRPHLSLSMSCQVPAELVQMLRPAIGHVQDLGGQQHFPLKNEIAAQPQHGKELEKSEESGAFPMGQTCSGHESSESVPDDAAKNGL
jgi:predicted nucleotidyltransferase